MLQGVRKFRSRRAAGVGQVSSSPSATLACLAKGVANNNAGLAEHGRVRGGAPAPALEAAERGSRQRDLEWVLALEVLKPTT